MSLISNVRLLARIGAQSKRVTSLSRAYGATTFNCNTSINTSINRRAFQPLTRNTTLRFFSDDANKKEEEKKAEAEVNEKADETKDAAKEEGKESESEKQEEETIETVKAKYEETVAEYEEKLKQEKDHLLRALAEVENQRQRSLRDVQNARDYALQSFAKQLLDVADNLERAMEAIPEEEIKAEGADQHLVSLHVGVGMTQTELQKVFKANGIVEYGEVGEKFDPNFHEALFQAPDETKEPNTVSSVMKTGYKLKDRVLRSAQVGVVLKK